MLPRKNRLRRAELVRVKEKGKMGEGGVVSFLFLRVPGGGVKFGWVVSNRVSKKAVERNRIKRKVRAAVGELLTKVKEGYHVVILGRRQVLTRETRKVREDLERGLRREGII